jgi:hypothetical protein
LFEPYTAYAFIKKGERPKEGQILQTVDHQVTEKERRTTYISKKKKERPTHVDKVKDTTKKTSKRKIKCLAQLKPLQA